MQRVSASREKREGDMQLALQETEEAKDSK
jgi:hypothetical protein